VCVCVCVCVHARACVCTQHPIAAQKHTSQVFVLSKLASSLDAEHGVYDCLINWISVFKHLPWTFFMTQAQHVLLVQYHCEAVYCLSCFLLIILVYGPLVCLCPWPNTPIPSHLNVCYPV